ncbi:Uncharacterised protein [Bordetella pertussis]|nr:Uncharacterised protein [Bordetella pertussis]CFP67698.1 Uncharacterised protein [Bordetella pertussis]CFW39375.1 Uncharacterised protein [Bordetella pertussis]
MPARIGNSSRGNSSSRSPRATSTGPIASRSASPSSCAARRPICAMASFTAS